MKAQQPQQESVYRNIIDDNQGSFVNTNDDLPENSNHQDDCADSRPQTDFHFQDSSLNQSQQ